MLSWIRERFGRVVVGGIIGFIAFVFIFYGVFNPSSTRGLHESAVAGTVNGESITLPEFNRAYGQRVEMFKRMGGGKLTEAQLRMFRLRESVFDELVRRKLLEQEARRLGVLAGDEEVRDRIRDYPVFQKDGHFDALLYKQVLQANNLSPGGFERMIRDEASVERLTEGLRASVRVTEREIQDEFRLTAEKREIKYVLFSSSVLRRKLKVDAADVDAFLKDEKNVNLVKQEFERSKDLRFKGRKFEDVRRELAEESLKAGKSAEIDARGRELAEAVLPLLGRGKADDARIEARLKEYGLSVKTTGLIGRGIESIPGLGIAEEVLADAFAEGSPIDLSRGGKARRYAIPAGTVVAAVVASESVDMARLPEQKDELRTKVLARRQRAQFDDFLKELRDRASIDPNPAVVSSDGAEGQG